MGVPGLWDVLRPAGQQRSLAQLAVHDGFERNPGGRRGLRVGIDASIWFFHATYGREGENPELRTLFFRCARLMSRPFLPLFVFDGPHRPEYKRKQKISGKDHWMVSGMQEIIEAFGFEWWCAPGEAEAELAYLNKIGVIDAIITDDVDTLLFGATTVIRNPGKMLSGNNAHTVKNIAGKDDGEHTYVYTATDILEHPDIALSQDGLILIALFRGGDYDPEGLHGCGIGVAHALSKCGFGEKLLSAARNLPHVRLQTFLDSWRNEVRAELRSNARGFLNSKKLQLAKSFPDTFPNIDVLQLYTHPVTSERKNKRPEFFWDREPDLMKLAALCELKFEWGVREIIIKRFRTVMWEPIVLRIIRRAVLDTDAAGPSTPRKKKNANVERIPPGTPSKMITQRFSSLSVADEDESQRLIVGIRGKREHTSTDGLPEYRLEINPAQLVRLTAAGVQGHRVLPSQYRVESEEEIDYDIDNDDDEGKTKQNNREKGGSKKPPPDPDSHLRVWMPACIIERVEPAMVAAYEGRAAQKVRDKEEKAAKKAAREATGANPRAKSRVKASTSGRKPRKATTRQTGREEEEEEELSATEDYSDVFGLPSKTRGKPGSGVKSRARTRPMLTMHEEEEEEEVEEVEILNSRPAPKNPKGPFSEGTNNGTAQSWKTALRTSPKTSSSTARTSSSLKASMESSKQKTILDLLDERCSRTRAISSSLSTSTRTRINSKNEHTIVPKPLVNADSDMWRWKGTVVSNRSAQTAESDTKKAASCLSILNNSDSEVLASPNKSQQKNQRHNSPSSRAKPACEKTDKKPKPGTYRNVVVDTITDSEDDIQGNEKGRSPSPSPNRPRVASTLNVSSGVGPKLSKSQHEAVPIEIIEITSGSEAESDKPSRPKSSLSLQPSKTGTATISTKRGSSESRMRRVDMMFPVVKPRGAVLKASLTKKGTKKPGNHAKSSKYNMDDVIEIT